jgi:hypothetical protein
MHLELALSYTPPGSDLSLTLATVRDVPLLLSVVTAAIGDAEIEAANATNQLTAMGFRAKLAYLRTCLKEIQLAGCCWTIH